MKIKIPDEGRRNKKNIFIWPVPYDENKIKGLSIKIKNNSTKKGTHKHLKTNTIIYNVDGISWQIAMLLQKFHHNHIYSLYYIMYNYSRPKYKLQI